MKPILSSLVFFFLSTSLICQNADSTIKQKLLDYGLYPYPPIEELQKNIFSDSLIKAQPLSNQDINNDFTNTEDLHWLKEIAQQNKVILLAEEHYHQFISNFRNRILFYLNTVDYYPLIVMEAQYSYTGFINYYLNIEDDKVAAKFYNEYIYDMVTTEDDYNLLQHIRKWNKINSSKKITVGYSDIEHDYKTTIKNVLIPYFKNIDKNIKIDVGNLSTKDMGELLPWFYSLLEKAKKLNLVGDYPFLTPGYISNILVNLESTFKAYYYQFDYYRQKAIVRNLTDLNFFGNYIIAHKVLIHGGNYHMTTHFNYPDKANFYREGSFLEGDFEPTKGKVYSISFHCFSRSLGKVANIDIDSCLQQGSYYISMVKQWQKAFNAKLVDSDKYLLDFNMNDLHKLILKTSILLGHQPILINKFDWSSILEIAKKTDNNLFNELKNWSDDYYRYDKHIFIPGSPFIVAMKKK